MVKDEPAYMLAARLSVESKMPLSPAIVEALVKRIDRMEAERND